MTRTGTTATREIGAALAVLAIWLVTLLAPMHQTSRLVGEMTRAGVIDIAAWSLCVPLDLDGEGGAAPVGLCPAQGLGLADLQAVGVATPIRARPAVLRLPSQPTAIRASGPRLRSVPSLPRAPPRAA